MKEHKFQIGQTVYFTSRPIGHMAANSTYEVVRLLPSDGADYQYRIKNPNEAFERVARESQLEKFVINAHFRSREPGKVPRELVKGWPPPLP